MSSVPAVDRKQVLAYRVSMNQLHERLDANPAGLSILDLGIPNVPAGTARQALAARSTRPLDGDLALAWSTRGAPHLHRPADLPAIAGALWPLDDADANGRFYTKQLPEAGKLGLTAFRSAADAFLKVVRAPTAKGDVSRAVSALVPAELTYDCGPCGSRHISGGLFQQAGLAGGVQLDETAPKTVLMPIDDWPGVPDAALAPDSLVRSYLRLLGPAIPGDVAKYFGSTVTALKPAWPDELAPVSVDGRKTWLPQEQLDALLEAAPVPGVRLLPPSDPFLQARDRTLLVPDKAQEKEVWRILGNPGVLLLDGDIAGTWRAKVVRKRLELTVTPWAPLTRTTRSAIESEAQTVAAIRDLPAADVKGLS
jgi:hypothetical protein